MRFISYEPDVTWTSRLQLAFQNFHKGVAEQNENGFISSDKS